MENIFNINRESNFKNEVVKSVPVGNNNITFNKNDNNDFRKEEINGNKPMLSGNKIFMPDNKKNKKVPLDTFSSIANSKKNLNSQTSSEVSGSDGSSSDELLSNNK